MKRDSSFTAVARRALEYSRLESRNRVSSTWDRDLLYRCHLCREQVRHPKSVARRGDVCLSCSMRNMTPRMVYVGDRAIERWRVRVGCTVQQMADRCDWSRERQHYLERQSRARVATMSRVARAYVTLAAEGADISAIIREWPLFVVLVDREYVCTAADAQGPIDLGTAPRDEPVPEERRPDTDGPHAAGS